MARRWNQSILKEINPEYSLKGLMLKLKLQYLGHLMWRTDSFEKTLMLGKIEGRRRRWQQRIKWLDGITDSIDMTLSKRREIVKDLEAWSAIVHGVTASCIWLSKWTTAKVEVSSPILNIDIPLYITKFLTSFFLFFSLPLLPLNSCRTFQLKHCLLVLFVTFEEANLLIKVCL